MEALVYPFLVANVLFFLYETDFFVQYVKLFRLSKLFKIKEYEAHLEGVGPDDAYWEWLAFRNQGFLSKLVSCPFCLGFWLNVLTCYLHKDVGLFLINLWLSLFLYLVLKLVMRKSYE